MKIGVFDSGVGGLTVLKAIHKLLPSEDLIYFGDSAHLPYGNKSAQNILEYSLNNVKFLLNQGAELIVIACNTSSAIARSTIEKRFAVPVTEVIIPGSEAALEKSNNQHITIASTFRTMSSHVYRDQILSRAPKAKVTEVSCPLFVPLIEEGFTDKIIIKNILQHYLQKPLSHSDTLVLGCTHYPLFKKLFQETFPHIHVVDSAEITAKKVKEIIHLHKKSKNKLSKKNLKTTRKGTVKIYTNDLNEVFTQITKKLFKDTSVKLIKN